MSNIIRGIKKIVLLLVSIICLSIISLEIQIKWSVSSFDRLIRNQELAMTSEDIAVFYAGTIGEKKLKETIDFLKYSNRSVKDLELALKYVSNNYVSTLFQVRVEDSNFFMMLKYKYLLLRQS